MPGFKTSIIVNEQSFAFEFAEVLSPSGLKYFVTIHNGCKRISSFEMKNILAGWNIVPPAPEWVNELEAKLAQTICDYLNERQNAKEP